MSLRLGKNGDSSRTATIQTRSSPGRQIAVFFCLVFLFDCSSLQQDKNLSSKELLSYVCTEGEGRGRLTLFNKSYSFGFESYMTKKKLTMGLDIPFHGEEILIVKFEPQIKIKGSFYRLIFKEVQDKKELQLILKQTFHIYGQFLKSFQQGKNHEHFEYHKGHLIFKGLSQGIGIGYSKLRKNYFSRQSIKMKIDGKKVALDMLYKKCYGRH